MNELCYRFATVRRSQIVPAALFKMLKDAAGLGQTANSRFGRGIYTSGSRHKSSEGNEKRRAVSRRVATEISV